MPLLDHFHPPLSTQLSWEAFHASWAVKLADALTEKLLPSEYIAEAMIHVGPFVEVDVATLDRSGSVPLSGNGAATATAATRVWSPVAPAMELPATFPDTFEVRVLSTESGPRLVAAIELVSPGNKDRIDERRAFCIKCASYLHQGVSLVLVDVVTNRRANLHNELVRLIEAGPAFEVREDVPLYTMAYRPLRRKGKNVIDVWSVPLALGDNLPLMPLALNADTVLPVDLEGAYLETCRKKRLL